MAAGELRLRDKVVLITGASLGIGKACAEAMAAEGAKVALTDIVEDEGKALADQINQQGGTARFWKMDVSDEDEVKAVFAEVEKAFGPITVLVNNAGISGINKPTHEIDSEDWDRVMNINVKGVFYCTKYGVPQMKRVGGGSIINLSSIYGLVSAPDVPPYHASKGAVTLMSKTDALLYAQDGIRVNSVHPGFIWTPMVENHAKGIGDVEEVTKSLVALHPIGHIGEPMDIAWGVVYLASDESKFVTGSELVLDGGYTCR